MDVDFQSVWLEVCPGNRIYSGSGMRTGECSSFEELQKDGTVDCDCGHRHLVYSAIGLLVKKIQHGKPSKYFQRKGAIRFVELERKNWEKICHACRQKDDTLSEENGERLILA